VANAAFATPLCARATELVQALQLAPHPEGGFYRELFRSPHRVQPLADTRPPRSALTVIDFLLAAGQFSAWHRVRSDEVWHLLEGGPLRLWIVPASLDAVQGVELRAASAAHAPRAVVGAGAWQAAEPLGEFAYVGATVGPGFDFADFDFGRADPALRAALGHLAPQTLHLL
jgi:predicted cupin superfamily sugar epimerase